MREFAAGGFCAFVNFIAGIILFCFRSELNLMLDKIALIFVIIGALNWGLVGLFQFDLVAFMFGAGAILSRIVYTLVALGGIWSISMLFRDNESSRVRD